MEREICPLCQKYPVAINYYRKDKVHYRRACTPCIHKRRQPRRIVPGWLKAGYKKSEKCDRCSFKFKSNEQSRVYYVDGDTKNNHWQNLRTVCLNCQPELSKTRWRLGDLQPDF